MYVISSQHKYFYSVGTLPLVIQINDPKTCCCFCDINELKGIKGVKMFIQVGRTRTKQGN